MTEKRGQDVGSQAAGAVDGADNQGLRPDAAVENVINTVVFNEELPQYNGNSRSELATWYLKAKDDYDRRVKNRMPIAWRELFKPEKLCYIANWGLENPVEVSLLTDQILTQWIGQQLQPDDGEEVNHIHAAMATLRMEFTPGLPQSGVEKFIQDCENMLQKYHLGKMRESTDGRERLIRILFRAARPECFRRC